MKFLPFKEARKFVHKLGLKTELEWRKYCKSGKKPENIPSTANGVYYREWKGWGDWLGTGKKTQYKGSYRSFDEARNFVRLLQLKNQFEWQKYCLTGNKPEDIPSGPSRVYKEKGWKNLGDWLGTNRIANQNKVYYTFDNARQLVHLMSLKGRTDWRVLVKSGKKDEKIPANPSGVYKSEWRGWGDWLGTGTIAVFNRKFKAFWEARNYAHALHLNSQNDWSEFCKSKRRPIDIPSMPSRIYKDEWKGWGDWLGTGNIAPQDLKYRNFNEARNFVHSLGLHSRKEWEHYCKSGQKPKDIPYQGREAYKRQWKGWGDWLGTNTIATHKREFRSFTDAKQYVQGLKLNNQEQWEQYCKSGNKPLDIPANPAGTYSKQWKGIGDWLGTGRTRDFLLFNDARRFVQSLRIKSSSEWVQYAKGKLKPGNIPADPSYVYRKDWKGWGDWLGTGTIAPQNRVYLPFEEARRFVHSLGLKTMQEWSTYTKSGSKPENIPANPAEVYKNSWISTFDWLGVQDTDWSITRVKQLLRGLIESKIIFTWDEAVLYSLLLRKGLLNIGGNRHELFFKNLILAARTEAGRNSIEQYANSDSNNPPDLSSFTPMASTNLENEIQPASTEDLARLAEYKDPLDYGQIQSVEQILKNTNILESINVDEEAMQFYLNYSIDELWKFAFKNEYDTVQSIKAEGKTGNKYHDSVLETFLNDYTASRKLRVPERYSFANPTLMQLYVTHKVKSLPYFGNFSGTGAGKTLSAILASRVINSKMTIIVCPNDVVEQWRRSVLEVFPNSEVITGNDAFYAKNFDNEYQYLVLNYDKFSQDYTPNHIIALAKQKIDFIVLDEVHFTKIRDESEITQRRTNLDGLMTSARKKNPDIKVLGLSATPMVNNLREGRSLLELITGKVYEDVATKPTIPNAVTLYEKLSTISIRELPDYHVDVRTEFQDVHVPIPEDIGIKELKSNPLSIEKFLTDARIPEIIKRIEGQTIIYTEYIQEIIKKLSDAVGREGYSYGFYTGDDRSGLKRFIDENIQVLIASRPISVGVDKLQHICNRLIINTLPWTNAQYQQLVGRLVRMGHFRDVVNVYIIKASIGGYPYDELKWKRIQFKRTLADCAVDGRLPEKNLVTPQQAAMEAVKWLERLERGEISTVVRRDLNVELTPVEIKKRVIKYGDFTRLNNKINSENSDTTHTRILKDPKEWDEYHRQYREARKSWPIVPFEEMIRRISQLSPRLLIGDFGCGEAKILEKFGAERVFSFDHVAINNKVTACDIKSVPLSDEAIDIAVFSLSLMGRNWTDYIKEAKRCLATNGYLLIAETTKSMKGRLLKLKEIIGQQGFDIYNEEEKGDFTFIEAREL